MTERNLVFNYSKDLPQPTEERLEYLRNQVKYLSTLPQPEQRTEAWYKMRENMLTASDWGTILGVCGYADRESVLLKKVEPDKKNFKSAAMAWGTKYEPVANMIYEKRNNVRVIEFGCIQHPRIPFLGASPDGITEDGVMVEIKCPTSRVITGEPPEYYKYQVLGQLEVTQLDRCDFIECKLKEITEEEYIELNNGMEKGVVTELMRRSDQTFVHEFSEIGIEGDELQRYYFETVMKYKNHPDYIFSCFQYWKLEEVSCVPIYRDDEWFKNALIGLTEFWEDVKKYRILGAEKLKEDIKRWKQERKEEKERKKQELLAGKVNSKNSKSKIYNNNNNITNYLILEGNHLKIQM